SSPFYAACPELVQRTMDRFGELTGRHYRLFDYPGAADGDRVLVLMGSAADTAHETVDWLLARGEKVGVLAVRLFRPLSAAALVAALPVTARRIALLGP